MSDEPSAAVKASKVGAFTAACLLVSNAVGSGIFTTTGFQARDIGDPTTILALWVVGGLLALTGAMSYGELGAALPRVGGEYIYLRRAFGPLVGFLSGWMSFTVGFGAAIAAGAMGFAAYFAALFPGSEGYGTLVGLVLIWSLTAVHLVSLETGGRFQRWITILKIGAVVVGIGVALAFGAGDVAHFGERTAGVDPGIGSLAIALIFVMYAFSGWNAASYIAGEMEDPARNLPRALVGGTLFITGFYVVVNLRYFYALSPEARAADPVLPVAEKVATSLFGPGAAALVSAVLCMSIAGSTSSMIWAGPRVYEAMAADGVAPKALAKRSARGVPAAAILAQSVWISALLFTGTFEQLVVYAGFALAIFSALGVGCVIALRIREPELERPYRVGFYPWVPLLYIASSLWIAVYAAWEQPTETLLSVLTVAIGVPVYYVWLRVRV
ncbi:MAG: amino acid permease [Myxococcota bacterium]|nr:amino acid permease [Myxococcota bacterium]